MASDNDDEMKRELERLRAENETLKQTKSDNISFKVGQKGLWVKTHKPLLIWSQRAELNRRPTDYETVSLR